MAFDEDLASDKGFIEERTIPPMTDQEQWSVFRSATAESESEDSCTLSTAPNSDLTTLADSLVEPEKKDRATVEGSYIEVVKLFDALTISSELDHTAKFHRRNMVQCNKCHTKAKAIVDGCSIQQKCRHCGSTDAHIFRHKVKGVSRKATISTGSKVQPESKAGKEHLEKHKPQEHKPTSTESKASKGSKITTHDRRKILVDVSDSESLVAVGIPIEASHASSIRKFKSSLREMLRPLLADKQSKKRLGDCTVTVDPDSFRPPLRFVSQRQRDRIEWYDVWYEDRVRKGQSSSKLGLDVTLAAKFQHLKSGPYGLKSIQNLQSYVKKKERENEVRKLQGEQEKQRLHEAEERKKRAREAQEENRRIREALRQEQRLAEHCDREKSTARGEEIKRRSKVRRQAILERANNVAGQAKRKRTEPDTSLKAVSPAIKRRMTIFYGSSETEKSRQGTSKKSRS
ncbi:MAG: hypothetical protein Q9227_005752 [Pyrenula ochraceoflavens]